MSLDHTVLAGGGAQTFWSYPRSELGAHALASVATYGIVNLRKADDDADRVVVAAGTAGTADSVNTTSDADAGAGEADPALVPVTSETGAVVGRWYQITDGAESEAFLLAGVETGLLRASHRLTKSFASGSTVRGLGWSFVFPLAVADDEDELTTRTPFRVLWTWTGVVPTKQAEFCAIQREDLSVRTTLADLLELDQTICAQVGAQVRADMYCRASDREIDQELRFAGLDPADFHLAQTGRLASAYLTLSRLYRLHVRDDGLAKWALEMSQRFVRELLVGRQVTGTVQRSRSSDTAGPDPVVNRTGNPFKRA